jgi:dGTPase
MYWGGQKIMSIEKTPLELSSNDIGRVYLRPLSDNALTARIYEEEKRYRADGPFQRDYSRIMYSSSFRRLQGKMQLLRVKNDQFFRNRLTHSLEVSQIARSIAFTVGYEKSEIYVVEAGALAHDIGNPPFGHSGERYLHELFADIGGFEGNAQTLRTLIDIEKKSAEFRGLNLTFRTLLSVLKYFNKFDKNLYDEAIINKRKDKQKFIYDSDYKFVSEIIKKNNINLRTLDVQIVDMADEIAYAAHDLEDGLRLKAFTIDEIIQDYQATYGCSEGFEILVKAVEDSKEKAGYGKSHIVSTEFSKLFRQELSSRLINIFMNDIDMIPISDSYKISKYTNQESELQFNKCGELASGLKKIVFKCINNNDRVYSYEQNGNIVLEKLTSLYLNTPMYLPPEYRAEELIKIYEDYQDVDQEKLQKRLVCDYVAGMMDSYAISMYEKFNGVRFMGGHY